MLNAIKWLLSGKRATVCTLVVSFLFLAIARWRIYATYDGIIGAQDSWACYAVVIIAVILLMLMCSFNEPLPSWRANLLVATSTVAVLCFINTAMPPHAPALDSYLVLADHGSYVDYLGADGHVHSTTVTAPNQRILHDGMDPHFRGHIKIEPASFLTMTRDGRWTVETWTQ